MDDITSLVSKGRFAQVVIEVDSARLLVPGTLVALEGIDMPPFWQRFEYEHLHLYCISYGRIGHRRSDCMFVMICLCLQTPMISIWP